MVMNPDYFAKDQGVYGVDAAHMKHRRYNGIKILLVGFDGNLSNQVAAVALAPVEDLDSYACFFKCVISHGYPLKSSPIFSDCNFGLASAATSFGVFNMHCFRHIIGTCVILCLFLRMKLMICTVFAVFNSLL